jgi:hypothetical protein
VAVVAAGFGLERLNRTGSYVLGFSVLAALAAMGSVLFLRARRPTHRPLYVLVGGMIGSSRRDWRSPPL